MKRVFFLAGIIMLSCVVTAQSFKQVFFNADISNFWKAYDKITATTDTALQRQIINDIYIRPGSAGLQELIRYRNYTDDDFLTMIRESPAFWKSLRKQTLNTEKLYPLIEKDLQKLKTLYPPLKPAAVYLLIGAFRTSGTGANGKVLIGSEYALAGPETNMADLPQRFHAYYRDFKPRENLGLLCTHEYVHTQQNQPVDNLLSNCLSEGIAEFISCKATGKASNTPAIAFGKLNTEKVVSQYVKDLFVMFNDYNWIWGENRNEFKVRDLGYYIGYSIAERYYELSADKGKAIRELIELDYTNDAAVERLVDTTRFLPKKLSELYTDYDKSRPRVIALSPSINGTKDVAPGLTRITVHFSEPLNGINTGIDFGPLGPDYFPKLSPVRVWSDDKRSITLEADLKPGKTYQFMIDNTFRREDQIRIKPFVVEFSTRE